MHEKADDDGLGVTAGPLERCKSDLFADLVIHWRRVFGLDPIYLDKALYAARRDPPLFRAFCAVASHDGLPRFVEIEHFLHQHRGQRAAGLCLQRSSSGAWSAVRIHNGCWKPREVST